jgi:hypothetical protein
LAQGAAHIKARRVLGVCLFFILKTAVGCARRCRDLGARQD